MAGEANARNYGLFERQDDVSSCAWFYLDRPANRSRRCRLRRSAMPV